VTTAEEVFLLIGATCGIIALAVVLLLCANLVAFGRGMDGQ